MAQYVPTRGVIERLDQLGISWAEMVADLQNAGHVQSLAGYETRQRHLGSKVQAYIEPGVYDGEPVLYVVGVRLRAEAGEPIPRQRQIVGREVRAKKSRRKGGVGRRWPTTWPELIKRIEMHPRCRVFKGKNHWLVYLNGKQVDALPATTSDHRALLNACRHLQQCGIDVSRTSVKKAS